ncbi:MAG: hypothetical protein CSA65_06750 [Proteobacteria bacterium]|nr:MAG: hypothetical protein CSB49_00270 [Pseudomonadota bacterium]PIE17980.1 MAG: hypothetical protein CSA65_06750 [Pseudomonadota bacterium]
MMHHPKAFLAALALFALVSAGCVEQEPDRPSAADWKIIKQNILKKAPKVKHPVNTDFEGKVEYIGLDVDKAVIRPGQQFTLVHYWKVKKAVPGWKVFTHLGDPKNQGKYYVNADHKPILGRYPATMWKPGEIIRDEHKVTLRNTWDAKKLHIYVGLWRGSQRLKPKGKHDKNRLLAAALPVAAPTVRKSRPSRKVPRLVATKSAKPVTIDGKLDDPVWAKAQWSPYFVNTLTGSRVTEQTRAKVAWDEKNLYLAFDVKDNDVWGSLKKRDDKLWTQEAIEVFIDANGDGKDYIELQVSPAGVIFDSYLAAYRKNDNAWNSGLKVKVKVDGTLNKRDDKDKGWIVEMALPLADAKGKSKAELKPPKLATVWRVNFFRMESPKKRTQVAAAWSPPLVGDFHKLDRFGELVFGDAEGKYPGMLMKKALVPLHRGKVVRMVRGAKIAPMALHSKRPMPRKKAPTKGVRTPAKVAPKKPAPKKPAK